MVKDWNYPSFLLENGVYLPLPTPPLNQGLDSSAYPTCVASNCSASSSSQGNLPGIKEIPDSSQLEFLRLLLFLGCCWVSPALCCVTADKAKARQRLCDNHWILSLSKSAFGEDPNGIPDFTNLMEDVAPAVRSPIPQGME